MEEKLPVTLNRAFYKASSNVKSIISYVDLLRNEKVDVTFPPSVKTYFVEHVTNGINIFVGERLGGESIIRISLRSINGRISISSQPVSSI